MPVPDLYQFIQNAHSAPLCKARLAPTPSGYLHLGNALNFVFNALLARLHPTGELLLRIDDMDTERKRPEYVADIFHTLNWLGIEWTEGPDGPDDFEKNWSQTLRMPTYNKALEACRSLVFPCALSRNDLEIYHGEYPEAFRHQACSLDDSGINWRANTPPGAAMPCFVIRRRDGRPAYQLVNICDDIDFCTTHIIRGDDLLPSTASQQWLARQLGWTSFDQILFCHHPLVYDAPGIKRSKSAGSVALREKYTKNESAAFVFQTAANWLGFPEKNVGNLYELAALLEQS